MEVKTQIEINATPEACWQVLADFGGYAAWNQVIPSVSGNAVAGGKGAIKIKLGPLPALKVPMKFVRVEPNRELCWRGGNDMLFVGEHYFRLEPGSQKGRTKLVHGEIFGGIVADLLGPLAESRIREEYEGLNESFKRRVESRK